MPDLSPLVIGGLTVVAVFAAVGTAGALSSSWDTVLLWQNRVPFAAASATAVVDPVFGATSRTTSSSCRSCASSRRWAGGCSVVGLVVVGGRYLLARARSGGFARRSASTWACWAGSTS